MNVLISRRMSSWRNSSNLTYSTKMNDDDDTAATAVTTVTVALCGVGDAVVVDYGGASYGRM